MIVEGVTITNPDRVVYPEAKLTKLDVARYLARIAPVALPHLAGRPLTFVRCPEGIAKECFYQKHWTGKVPAALETVTIKQSDGKRKPYIVVTDVRGLVTLAQWGILEIHLWGARADDLEHPDRVIFDLDPGPETTWGEVREAAHAVKATLAALDLTSWLKTTGGNGLHVVVPIARRSTWAEVSDFARLVSEHIAKVAPDRFVTTAAKADRAGRIFIDWLRNTRGATAVAPWSMRARPAAGVAEPLAWTRLAALARGDGRTVGSLLTGRIPTDPWGSIARTRQGIGKRMLDTLAAR